MQKKIINTLLASTLSIALAGCAVNANETKETSSPETKTKTTSTANVSKSETTGKDETVYVFMNGDGDTQKVVVSDILHTAGKTGAVTDFSNLKNITNVSGDETMSSDNNGNITWNSVGNDISYQGTSDAKIPVSVKVTYTLDGKQVSADEIKGKSGHVTMRFDYQNDAKVTINTNGGQKEIPVPFGMVTGLTLDSNDFSHISVTNGKVMKYNNEQVIYGMALPGLEEAFDSSNLSDKPNIPDYVEFEADTTNFNIEMAMTIATTDLLSLLQSDSLDSSTLSNDVNQLDSNGQKLVDGSNQLKDGTSQLLDGSTKLDNGASDLLNGTQTLSNGATDLNNGANELSDGASKLYDGIAQASDGSKALLDGAKQLQDGAAQLDGGVDSALAGANQLKGGLDTLTSNNEALNDAMNQLVSKLLEQGTQALQAVNTNAPKLTEDNYETVLSQLSSAISAMNQAQAAQLEALSAQIKNAIKLRDSVKAYTTGVSQAAQGSSDLVDGLNKLKTGSSQLSKGSTDLYNGIVKLGDGANQLVLGADSLKQGSEKLANGTATLKDGSLSLLDGVKTLKNGTTDLKSGVVTLNDGAKTLADGMNQYYAEGIKQLIAAYSDDLQPLIDVINAANNGEASYTSFGGAVQDPNNTCKFIFKMSM